MGMQEIGSFIASLRREKNMTQADLAKIVHVTVQAVSKWECGKGLPQVNLILPLSDALGVSAAELLNGSRAAKADEKSIKKVITEYDQLRNREAQIRRIHLLKKVAVSSIICILTIVAIVFLMMHIYIPIPYGNDRLGSIIIEKGNNDSYFVKLIAYKNEHVQYKLVRQDAENGSRKISALYLHAELPIWDYLFSTSDYIRRFSIDSNNIDAIFYTSSNMDKLTSRDYSNVTPDDVSLVWEYANGR